jgi:hypothetical protein
LRVEDKIGVGIRQMNAGMRDGSAFRIGDCPCNSSLIQLSQGQSGNRKKHNQQQKTPAMSPVSPWIAVIRVHIAS